MKWLEGKQGEREIVGDFEGNCSEKEAINGTEIWGMVGARDSKLPERRHTLKTGFYGYPALLERKVCLETLVGSVHKGLTLYKGLW